MNLQYWINQNGAQSGPYTIEQLQGMSFDKNNTYVWHKGMDGWMRIDKVAELADLVVDTAPVVEEQPVAVPEADEAHVSADEIQETESSAEEQVVGSDDDMAGQQDSVPVPPAYEAPEPPTPPVQAPEFVQPQMAPVQASAPAQEPAPECPPTNLVAAIVCAVLCCTPLAVVAIVLAVMTKNKYQAGDYEKAKKYSDWGAWLCILSVVLSVLFMPFSMIML